MCKLKELYVHYLIKLLRLLYKFFQSHFLDEETETQSVALTWQSPVDL